MHKITFSEKCNLSLTIKSSLSPNGSTGCLKKSKSNGIVNLLWNVILITFFWVITVIAVPSANFAPTRAFKPLVDCMPWSSFSSRPSSLKERSLYVNVLIWICYIWHVGLDYMLSLDFEGKLCSMFYHGIWFSVNTHCLYLIYNLIIVFFNLWWRLQNF